MIHLACPQCAAKINAPDAAAGRTLPCPRCATKVTIPPPPLPREAVVATPARSQGPASIPSATPIRGLNRALWLAVAAVVGAVLVSSGIIAWAIRRPQTLDVRVPMLEGLGSESKRLQPADDGVRHPPGKPAQFGPVELTVRSAFCGRVRESDRASPIFVVRLEVANRSDNRVFKYGVMDELRIGKPHTLARDNHGNKYGLSYDVDAVVRLRGMTREATLHPGDSIRDAIAFDKVVKTADWVDVEVSLARCGQDGLARFRLPADFIHWGDEQD